MSLISAAARVSRGLPGDRTKIRAGRAFAQVAIRSGASPICRTTLDDGTVLDLDTRSRTEASAIWQGSYEPEYRQALTDLLDRSERRSYFDVGANVGLLAVPIARHLGDHSVGLGDVLLVPRERIPSLSDLWTVRLIDQLS